MLNDTFACNCMSSAVSHGSDFERNSFGKKKGRNMIIVFLWLMYNNAIILYFLPDPRHVLFFQTNPILINARRTKSFKSTTWAFSLDLFSFSFWKSNTQHFFYTIMKFSYQSMELRTIKGERRTKLNAHVPHRKAFKSFENLLLYKLRSWNSIEQKK